MASKLEETIGSAAGEAACGASPAAEITAPKTQYVAYRLFIVNLFKNVPLGTVLREAIIPRGEPG
jgi:hypothetical protein